LSVWFWLDIDDGRKGVHVCLPHTRVALLAVALSVLDHTPSLSHISFQAKINTKIDLESPKVATMIEMKPGEKKVFCRCW